MATISVPRSPTTAPTARHDLSNPVFQGLVLLRIGFTAAPIVFGLDKFLGWLVDWRVYLVPEIGRLIPGNAHQALLPVGVFEIVAAGRDRRQPSPGGRFLRHRAARRRPAARGADPGPAGDGVRPLVDLGLSRP